MGSIQTYLKTVVFTILVPGTVSVAIPQLLARWRKHPKLPLNEQRSWVVGNLCLVSGFLLYVRTSFQFAEEGGEHHHRQTNQNVSSLGGSTLILEIRCTLGCCW